MGKKKKSGNGKAATPKPKPSAAVAALEQSKLGLLANLSSSSASDRAVACGVASHMLGQFDDPVKIAGVCKLLASAGVIAKLLQLVCSDPDNNVTTAAAKSLRNFCLTGPGACELLAKMQAPAAILAFMNSGRFQFGAPLPPLVQELFSHLFSLLAAIAANQDDSTIEVCLRPDFLNAAFLLLVSASESLRMEIVSFLCVASEDNAPLASAILSQPTMLAQLHKLLLGSAEPYTRSAAAAVLLNAVSSVPTPLNVAVEITTAVLQAVDSMLEIDPATTAHTMITSLQQQHQAEEAKHEAVVTKEEKGNNSSNNSSNSGEEENAVRLHMQEMEDETKEMKKQRRPSKNEEDEDGITQNDWEKLTWEQLSHWRSGVQGVKQSLEVLTNIVALVEENSGGVQGLAEHLAREITNRQLPNKVFRFLRCAAVPTGDQELVIPHQQLLEGFLSIFASEEAKAGVILLHSVRSAAAACASNLCLHFPLEVLGDIPSVVREACSVCRSLEPWMGQEEWAIKEIEAFTTLIWNATRKGASLEKGQLQCVMALGRATIPSDEVRVNVAGILGAVGSKPAHFPYNFVIGSSLLTLMERCAQDETSSLELAAEVVNSLIDVYTEDNVHSAQVTQLELLPKLAAFLVVLKKRYRRIRSTVDPILQDRVDETLENLEQFVEYKKLHI